MSYTHYLIPSLEVMHYLPGGTVLQAIVEELRQRGWINPTATVCRLSNYSKGRELGEMEICRIASKVEAILKKHRAVDREAP